LKIRTIFRRNNKVYPNYEARQLARKLELRPAEIVSYLALNSIQIESGGNTRLEDEYVKLILQKFAPQGLSEDLAEAGEEEKTGMQEPEQPLKSRRLKPLQLPLTP